MKAEKPKAKKPIQLPPKRPPQEYLLRKEVPCRTEFLSGCDPFGMYTGNVSVGKDPEAETPTQDADDL